jgi:hypothetical protein
MKNIYMLYQQIHIAVNVLKKNSFNSNNCYIKF